MGPALHSTFRVLLRGRRVQNQSIHSFLSSFPRYENDFKKFWASCDEKQLSSKDMTLMQMTDALLQNRKKFSCRQQVGVCRSSQDIWIAKSAN
jgi:hypothetical protein